MLVAKGAHHQNDGEARPRDKLMSARGPSQPNVVVANMSAER
jgi:hypothetical protein